MFREFIVIIPDRIKNVSTKLKKMLEPYSFEVNRIQPEIEKCYCGREIARKETELIISKEFPDLGDQKYMFCSPNIANKYTKLVDDRIKSHPLYKKADPHCKTCNGLGTYNEYYNPNGKFDFWDIGYGWEEGLRTITHREKDWVSQNDIIMVEDITDEFIENHPFLPIVTPDGIWNEYLEHMFEKDQTKLDNAIQQMKETFKKYVGHKAVKCKMHF